MIFFIFFRISEFNGDDLNPALAETYARYGSLLLRLAIKNNDQNILSSDSATAIGTAETTEALLQAASSNKNKVIEFSGDYEDDEEEDQVEGSDNDENGKDEQEQGQEEAEDEDDFTIAWENLDVARLLFEKRIASSVDEAEKASLNRALGFVYRDLGDLSLENGILVISLLITLFSFSLFLENFVDAVSEYELAISSFGVPSADLLREFAGVCFNLALSLEFIDKLVDAKSKYIEAKSLLEQAESNIISKGSNEDADDADEKTNVDESVVSSSSSSSELSELRGLIAEISLKIDDMNNNNTAASINQELQSATSSAALSAAQSLNNVVNDLSGMIKKRKADPAVESQATVKESKVDEDSKDNAV